MLIIAGVIGLLFAHHANNRLGYLDNSPALIIAIASAAAILYGIHAAGNRINNLERNWLTWPTFNEYLSQYPHAATTHGPACRNCRSRQIWRHTWHDSTPQLHIHRCRTCGENLYRTSH